MGPSASSDLLCPSHPRTPRGNLFFNQGISVRAGEPIELVVPEAFGGRYSLDFAAVPVPSTSSLGEGESAILVQPCPPSSQGPWTAFSGGFLARKPVCAVLVIQADARSERTQMSLGRRCYKY